MPAQSTHDRLRDVTAKLIAAAKPHAKKSTGLAAAITTAESALKTKRGRPAKCESRSDSPTGS